MKSHIKYIGVLDKNNEIHHVEFTTGVNIITGKSSTGKSAMIEIFDYCMGSSEFNIPSGIITDRADIYFIVLAVKDTYLVIGRNPNKTKIFLKVETILPNIESLKIGYFEDRFYTRDFNVNLGHYFGLVINDIEEDTEIQNYRGRKKGRPSIRNMIPYLVQHQNLIANKHSIFYRFDQKEKREQTIDQFKIFAEFVTQEYYIIKQQLADKERKLKKLENQQKSIDAQKDFNSANLDMLLKEYVAISGYKLFEESSKVILTNPANYLQRIDTKQIQVDYESEKSLKELKTLQAKINNLYAQKRKLIYKLNNISSSVKYANQYKDNLDNSLEDNQALIKLSECPFCHKHNEDILKEANELEDAISWLNDELNKTPYLLDSFESDKKLLEVEVEEVDIQIRETYKIINTLKSITKNLGNNKSLEEQTLKVKLKIENLLESLLDENYSDIKKQISDVKKRIKAYNKQLKDSFNVSKKLSNAEIYINSEMEKLGEKFDFEDSYKPINLKFSLDSFDLWHEKENEKVYLRSMGSGANWLYSHLTLFMALHKYFCSLQNKSLIPPILFLDQPSQVYFPTTIKDNQEEFDAKEIEKKKGEGDADEDLKAVTNLFNQLVIFCKNTLKETGIEPQIIITDHADNLTLDNDVNFEDLVNGRRWRKRGFIEDIGNIGHD